MVRVSDAVVAVLLDFVGGSERGEAPSVYVARGIAHAATGAALVALAGPWAWAMLPVYAVKEWRDWRRHGALLADCVGDLAYVALGIVTGPVAWPVVAGVAAVVREVARR